MKQSRRLSPTIPLLVPLSIMAVATSCRAPVSATVSKPTTEAAAPLVGRAALIKSDPSRRAYRRTMVDWRQAVWRDEKGQIPAGTRELAYAEVESRRGVAIATTGGFSEDNWRQGPNNVAGRTRALSIDPRNANFMVAGSASGGLWRTTNGGTSWTPVSDSLPSLAISSIVRSAVNPDILVAGTGEPYLTGAFGWGGFTGVPFGGGNEALDGANIYRSTDNGVTWTRIASGPVTTFKMDIATVGSTEVILATGAGGAYRSVDLGLTWTLGNLPVESGWSNGTAGNVVFQDVDFNRNNPQQAVATFYWRRLRQFCSTPVFNVDGWYEGVIMTFDAGQNWFIPTPFTSPRTNATGVPLPGFAIDPITRWRPLQSPITTCGVTGFFQTAPTNFLPRLEVEIHNNAIYVLTEFGGLFRSTNGGTSFASVGALPNQFGLQGWYNLALWIDPTDTDLITANDFILVGGVTAFRSINGGAAFTQISDDLVTGSAHDDHHLFVEHPGLRLGQNRIMFTVTDGGVYRANNINTVTIPNWVSINSGMATTQFYGASRNPDTMVTIGGTQDQGGLSTVDFAPFQELRLNNVTLGDAGMSVNDTLNPDVHYLCGFEAQVLRVSNGGQTVVEIRPATAMIPGQITVNPVAPIAWHPNTGSPFLLIGDSTVQRCNNPSAAVPTWAPVTGLPADPTNPIAAIAIGTNPNEIWAARNFNGPGPNQSRVFRSVDGGVTWTEESFPRPNRLATRLTIDPNTPGRVFLTLGGASTDNLWERDQTGTWQPITTPAVPARDFELHPTLDGVYLLATQLGLFVSADFGGTWKVISPASISIEEIFWSRDQLHLVTHGRGLFSQSPFAAATSVSVGQSCQVGGGATTGPNLTSQLPILGTTVTLNMSQATANTLAAILLGNPPTTIPPLCGAQAVGAITLGQPFVTSATGTGSASVPLPADLIFAGLEFVAQSIEFPGSNIRLSNGLRWTCGF